MPMGITVGVLRWLHFTATQQSTENARAAYSVRIFRVVRTHYVREPVIRLLIDTGGCIGKSRGSLQSGARRHSCVCLPALALASAGVRTPLTSPTDRSPTRRSGLLLFRFIMFFEKWRERERESGKKNHCRRVSFSRACCSLLFFLFLSFALSLPFFLLFPLSLRRRRRFERCVALFACACVSACAVDRANESRLNRRRLCVCVCWLVECCRCLLLHWRTEAVHFRRTSPSLPRCRLPIPSTIVVVFLASCHRSRCRRQPRRNWQRRRLRRRNWLPRFSFTRRHLP